MGLTRNRYHYQPINAHTAEAKAFFMYYSQGERDITHHAGPMRISEEIGVGSVAMRHQVKEKGRSSAELVFARGLRSHY
jgi:hypothetical protein